MKLLKCVAVSLFALLSIQASPLHSFGALAAEDASAASDTNLLGLANGIYLVSKKSEKIGALIPNPNQTLAIYDYSFFEPDERQEPTFLLLQNKPFIPMTLGSDPELNKGENGKPSLNLQLAPEQIEPLKKFTSDNLGKTIAIVIGGNVISDHKIKSVIEGGKLQITRCTDHGCEVIHSELMKSKKKQG